MFELSSGWTALSQEATERQVGDPKRTNGIVEVWSIDAGRGRYRHGNDGMFSRKVSKAI